MLASEKENATKGLSTKGMLQRTRPLSQRFSQEVNIESQMRQKLTDSASPKPKNASQISPRGPSGTALSRAYRWRSWRQKQSSRHGRKYMSCRSNTFFWMFAVAFLFWTYFLCLAHLWVHDAYFVRGTGHVDVSGTEPRQRIHFIRKREKLEGMADWERGETYLYFNASGETPVVVLFSNQTSRAEADDAAIIPRGHAKSEEDDNGVVFDPSGGSSGAWLVDGVRVVGSGGAGAARKDGAGGQIAQLPMAGRPLRIRNISIGALRPVSSLRSAVKSLADPGSWRDSSAVDVASALRLAEAVRGSWAAEPAPPPAGARPGPSEADPTLKPPTRGGAAAGAKQGFWPSTGERGELGPGPMGSLRLGQASARADSAARPPLGGIEDAAGYGAQTRLGGTELAEKRLSTRDSARRNDGQIDVSSQGKPDLSAPPPVSPALDSVHSTGNRGSDLSPRAGDLPPENSPSALGARSSQQLRGQPEAGAGRGSGAPQTNSTAQQPLHQQRQRRRPNPLQGLPAKLREKAVQAILQDTAGESPARPFSGLSQLGHERAPQLQGKELRKGTGALSSFGMIRRWSPRTEPLSLVRMIPVPTNANRSSANGTGERGCPAASQPPRLVPEFSSYIYKHAAAAAAGEVIRYVHMGSIAPLPGGGLLVAFQASYFTEGAVDQRIYLSYSRDGDVGQRWTKPARLPVRARGAQWGPVLHVHPRTGSVWLFFTESRNKSCLRFATRSYPQRFPPGGDVLVTKTHDGKVWMEPRTIYGMSEDGNSPKVIANSVHVTSRGAWLLPFWRESYYFNRDTPCQSTGPDGHGVLVSRDEGKTWAPRGNLTMPVSHIYEGSAAELGDGTVVMVFRSQVGAAAVSRSTDDGETWSEPMLLTANNPDSKPNVINLRPNGEVLMAYNDHSKSNINCRNCRSKLTISRLVNATGAWDHLAQFGPSPSDYLKVHYPTMLQHGCRLLVVYSSMYSCCAPFSEVCQCAPPGAEVGLHMVSFKIWEDGQDAVEQMAAHRMKVAARGAASWGGGWTNPWWGPLGEAALLEAVVARHEGGQRARSSRAGNPPGGAAEGASRAADVRA
mmetsp:Transcript_9248/g.22285  ORF Transcript_9248/g.22285 Transcript_9248/m.22285 type:complete len:1073 (-) Transcript_9248:14-3232(-)